MGARENGTRRNRGTVLEGRSGLVAAIVLGGAAVALAVAQWVLLPDQVATHFGITGEVNGWSPKWFPVLLSGGLGLFGSVWLGVSREKLGLLLAVIGVLIGVIDLAVNGLMM